jgi:enoyl-CoA hydratase/carnithine racemase
MDYIIVVPVTVAINGDAIGQGLELVLASDISSRGKRTPQFKGK